MFCQQRASFVMYCYLPVQVFFFCYQRQISSVFTNKIRELQLKKEKKEEYPLDFDEENTVHTASSPEKHWCMFPHERSHLKKYYGGLDFLDSPNGSTGVPLKITL